MATSNSSTLAGRERTDAVQPRRLVSVDVLRGLTIGFMILVNNNGNGRFAYWPLKHSAWNGFTPTDLVFPMFLFLVGITTVFSTAARLEKGATRKSLFLHILRRSIVLYLLGLIVNSFPHFYLKTMRFYGVLPRIAICYFVVASLYLVSQNWRTSATVAIGALVCYWVLMRFVPVPGYGVPTRDVPLLDHDGNLTAWLDRQIFSASHLYEHTRDPEGLLSTLPAIATTLFGLLTGIYLRTKRTLAAKATWMTAFGVAGVLLGLIWDITLPINKKLWTSSYVLFAGGLSLLLLALSLVIVDSDEKRSGLRNRSRFVQVLLVFGTNAIVAYVFSELLQSTLGSIYLAQNLKSQQMLYQSIQHVVPDLAFASLLYSLAFVFVCWLFVFVLYRHGIFLKV
jgi:predicted acyltransferase